jgi:hypothetical protein
MAANGKAVAGAMFSRSETLRSSASSFIWTPITPVLILLVIRGSTEDRYQALKSMRQRRQCGGELRRQRVPASHCASEWETRRIPGGSAQAHEWQAVEKVRSTQIRKKQLPYVSQDCGT